VKLALDLSSADDYATFLKVKSLPKYTFTGRVAEVPDEYAGVLGRKVKKARGREFEPHPRAFDYQRDIGALAVRKRKFAVFMGCGWGKSLILLMYARHVTRVAPKKGVLIVCPLMVVRQTAAEAAAFYGDDLPVKVLKAAEVPAWLATGNGVAVTNFEAIRDDLPADTNLAALVVDESSMMKSHYGKWGTRLIELGKGLDWKLCLTGTPAPNDRIEYANHAVFLDHEPNVNAFLARYFVNRGETANRWEMKPHALKPFYRSLAHWCVFVGNPAAYGWKDNAGTIPPVVTHVHDVPLTDAQSEATRKLTGNLFGVVEAGGIVGRGKLSQLAKGRIDGERVETHKTGFVADLVRSFGDRSSIVWCKYNPEQNDIADALPGCASVSGSTGEDERAELIEAFQRGERRTLVSKPKVLGFGLNLQRCTRMVFSTVQDSYEEYHQAVKRANRVGSSDALEVHIPVTELERPMLDTVLAKAGRVEADTREQEAMFREMNRDLLTF
jgi:superfamily II DNA or RNA helicase